jgi:hypothetical protein
MNDKHESDIYNIPTALELCNGGLMTLKIRAEVSKCVEGEQSIDLTTQRILMALKVEMLDSKKRMVGEM